MVIFFRNYGGFSKGCSAKPPSILFAFEAELMGIITAIDYARRFDWDYIWFECDSTYVVELLQTKSNKVSWRFLSRWNKTINYLDHITYHASQIFREGNQVADNLASYAAHIAEDAWYAPTSCSSLLHRDLVGLLVINL